MMRFEALLPSEYREPPRAPKQVRMFGNQLEASIGHPLQDLFEPHRQFRLLPAGIGRPVHPARAQAEERADQGRDCCATSLTGILTDPMALEP
jgi:hypothetical protein